LKVQDHADIQVPTREQTSNLNGWKNGQCMW